MKTGICVEAVLDSYPFFFYDGKDTKGLYEFLQKFTPQPYLDSNPIDNELKLYEVLAFTHQKAGAPFAFIEPNEYVLIDFQKKEVLLFNEEDFGKLYAIIGEE